MTTRTGGAAWSLSAPLVLLGAALALFTAAQEAGAQLRYDREYPSIPYSSGTRTDPVARLFERVAAGESALEFEDRHGYLTSLLDALRVPWSSQSLVFTRTSFMRGVIGPANPRALYFDDEVYVAWTKGGDFLEIAAVDPLLGAVFYTLDQERTARPEVVKQEGLCLQCHDTYGLTGGGVPELIVGSMLPDARGDAVAHEGWFSTTHRSPLRVRWGGWYVTGTHGEQTHMGNVIVRSPAEIPSLDFRGSGNLTDLGQLVDTSPLPLPHSDIVALMVLEHQVTVQNLIIHMNYRVRTALHEAGLAADVTGAVPPSVQNAIEEHGEALLHGLFFSGEAPITAPIRGTSGFSEAFSERGPFDERARSLRQLDMERRMFRYPLSYLVYSPAYDGLPPVARAYMGRRIGEVLAGQDTSEPFRHLTGADRQAIREILEATRPEVMGAG